VAGKVDNQLLKRWATNEVINRNKNIVYSNYLGVIDETFHLETFTVEPLSNPSGSTCRSAENG
jgi:hypothetical protein